MEEQKKYIRLALSEKALEKVKRDSNNLGMTVTQVINKIIENKYKI